MTDDSLKRLRDLNAQLLDLIAEIGEHDDESSREFARTLTSTRTRTTARIALLEGRMAEDVRPGD